MTPYQFECWKRKIVKHEKKKKEDWSSLAKFIQPVFKREYGEIENKRLNAGR